jgi:dTDP-glucose 4,6-dehydratase
LLELSVRLQARRFLLTSSGGVYGPQPSEMLQISENYCGFPDPLKMSSSYGIGKRMAEHISFVYGDLYGIEIVIARCFAFVGEDLPMNAHFAIGNFIRDAMRGETIKVGGDGTPMRSYLYASDLAVWLWTLLFRAPGGCAFNVGSDQDLSIASLAETVHLAINPAVTIEISRHAMPGSSVERYVPATTSARTQLDLHVRIPLSVAIMKTAAWNKASPGDCP